MGFARLFCQETLKNSPIPWLAPKSQMGTKVNLEPAPPSPPCSMGGLKPRVSLGFCVPTSFLVYTLWDWVWWLGAIDGSFESTVSGVRLSINFEISFEVIWIWKKTIGMDSWLMPAFMVVCAFLWIVFWFWALACWVWEADLYLCFRLGLPFWRHGSLWCFLGL